MNTLIRTDRFLSWVKGIKDPVARAAIATHLDRMTLGTFGNAKSLKGGLYEMRIDVGVGYRLYYTQRGLTTYLLLCGGDKRKQDRDIRLAREMIKQLKED